MAISDQRWEEFLEIRRKRKRVDHPSAIPVIISLVSHVISIGVIISKSRTSEVPSCSTVKKDDVDYYDSDGNLIDPNTINLDEVDLVEATLEENS